MINIPPRHGKSRTLVLFTTWILGLNNENRVITASYNDDLATQFSRSCRDNISQEKTLDHEIVYSDIFQNTKIKYGDSSYKKWALEGQFFSYKGAGLGSGVTGLGCNISISDDLIKDAATAFSETSLQKINSWYTDTFASRREDTKINSNGEIERPSLEIVCFTRWSSKDLCGKFLSKENPEKDTWYILKMEAYNENTGEMLCEDILSYERYKSIESQMNPSIFQANYNQKEIDSSNRLFTELKTYDTLPKKDGNIIYDKHYTVIDTADTGTDRTVAIDFYSKDGDVYITDIYGSQKAMEYTEQEVSEFIIRNKPDEGVVESNNGGRGYKRSIERILRERRYYHTILRDEPQTKNKETRILTNSTYIQHKFYLPINWHIKYKEAFLEVMQYSTESKSEHDDYIDVLTKIAEIVQEDNDINIRFL